MNDCFVTKNLFKKIFDGVGEIKGIGTELQQDRTLKIRFHSDFTSVFLLLWKYLQTG